MESPPQQPRPDDDWLLSPSTASTEPAYGEPVDVTASPTTDRRRLLTTSRLVAAGLLAGALGTFALGHHSSSTTTFQNAGNNAQQGPGGTGFPPGMQGAQGGGTDGEQRLQGTLTAVGDASITVDTSSGTATYTVTSSTQIVRNGQPATLSELKKGDPVLVHVYPLNGRTVVERVFAGTMSQGGFPGGPGAPGGFAPGGQGTSQQTQPGGVVNG